MTPVVTDLWRASIVLALLMIGIELHRIADWLKFAAVAGGTQP